jgi:quercetin dioxygenase-like cupin family protein
VLGSDDDGRAVLISLPAGDSMREHEVQEHAWLHVVSGAVRVRGSDGEVEAAEGTLVSFPPAERREITAIRDARVLLLLTPWPAPNREPWASAPAEIG